MVSGIVLLLAGWTVFLYIQSGLGDGHLGAADPDSGDPSGISIQRGSCPPDFPDCGFVQLPDDSSWTASPPSAATTSRPSPKPFDPRPRRAPLKVKWGPPACLAFVKGASRAELQDVLGLKPVPRSSTFNLYSGRYSWIAPVNDGLVIYQPGGYTACGGESLRTLSRRGTAMSVYSDVNGSVALDGAESAGPYWDIALDDFYWADVPEFLLPTVRAVRSSTPREHHLRQARAILFASQDLDQATLDSATARLYRGPRL